MEKGTPVKACPEEQIQWRSRLLLLSWCRARRTRLYVGARSYEWNFGHVGHFASFSVRQVDSRMLKQQPRRAIKFDLGFFVCSHRRDQVRFGGRKLRLIVQDVGAGRSAKRIFFLLGIK